MEFQKVVFYGRLGEQALRGTLGAAPGTADRIEAVDDQGALVSGGEHEGESGSVTVTLVDTGLEAMTGARVRKVRSLVGDDDFFLTYGDGVSDVPIDKCVAFHDSHSAAMTLKIGKKKHQDATAADMILSCAELIAFASRFMVLEPGDIFATGTPDGVGDTSGTYLKKGQVMEGWIEGIGTLVTPVGPAFKDRV